MSQIVAAHPVKRFSKISAAYALYLGIVWAFDYIYYPWLTYRFRHYMVLPLYTSLFVVSLGGYYLYQFFQEDIFFTQRIHAWLAKPCKRRWVAGAKEWVTGNPRWTFAAISTWWSPLHAYIFFRRGEGFEFWPFVKDIAKGSMFCAIFWGIVAEAILRIFTLVWHFAR